MPSFDEQIEKEIPATFFMFSGAGDSQQSADVSSVKTFKLPDPNGQAGGACTSALLQVCYRDEKDTSVEYSWTETLEQMREKIEEIGLPQVPQLSSSRPIDVNETLTIVPQNAKGTKRAMLVGINYVGEDNALTGCHNDAQNIKHFLIDVHGFKRENILLLLDDGKHHEPTKDMIMAGFHKLAEISKAGDVIFIHFSGHGGQMPDTSGDEDDGFDEILIPSDFKESGQIVDDDIYSEFVTKVKKGVTVTCLIDCCHSGTAMDLPYVCNLGDTEIRRDDGFKIPLSGMDLVPQKKKDKKEKKDKKPKKAPKKSSKKQPEPEPDYDDEDENYDDQGEYGYDEDYDEDYEGEYDEEYDQGEEEEEPEPEVVEEKKKKKKGFFGFGKRKKK